MSHPLTPNQLALLARADSAALTASTLRAYSEMRWLQHLGLVTVDGEGRFAITPAGAARLAIEPRDSRLDV